MADLKRRALFVFDFIRMTLPAFHDFWLKFKSLITGENLVGIHIGICNSSEVRLAFKDCVAGGYTGFYEIKLFARPECGDYVECTEEILNHEVLHQVIDKVAGHEAKMALDNIHRSFYCYDEANKKWRFVVEFVFEDKPKKILQII